MKAKYLVSDDVADLGMRVFITSFMIENGFEKGIAKNVSENEVEVLVDLSSKDPEMFRRDLEQVIHTQFKGTNEPRKIKVRLEETADDGNPIGEIPNIMLSSQMLQLEQMGKFITVGSDMSRSIESMSAMISSMGDSIKAMGDSIKAIGNSMKDGFESMGKQMKDGFKILAEAFRK